MKRRVKCPDRRAGSDREVAIAPRELKVRRDTAVAKDAEAPEAKVEEWAARYPE